MAKAIAFEECNDESEDETIDAIMAKARAFEFEDSDEIESESESLKCRKEKVKSFHRNPGQ